MEEIDNIIIDSLKNLHCEIEDDVTSLKQFEPTFVVKAISSCLEAIIPNSKFPKSLPPTMSHKLKITSNLAEQIKKLGYRDDIGYQTILYSNETEIRRIFMFLVERLPRETLKTPVEETGYMPTLIKAIDAKMKECAEKLWVPTTFFRGGHRPGAAGPLFQSFGHSTPLRTRKLEIPKSGDSCNEALKQYWIHNVPEVTRQCAREELIPSLLFHDLRLKHNDPSFRGVFKLETDFVADLLPEIGGKAAAIERGDGGNRMGALLESVQEHQAKYLRLKETLKQAELEALQIEAQKAEEQRELDEILSKITLKTKTLTIISKEENLEKLENLIETNNRKLVNMAEEWNRIQAPLLDEYKALESTKSDEDLRKQQELNKLEKMKEIYNNLKVDLHEKIQLEEQLKAKLDQVSQGTNRAGYTQRIMEIIGNINKQNIEIDKIINDTREVQREISNLSGQVDRSFTIADEMIFRDAKQDEMARKAYKLLAQLRDDCSTIIKAVTDLGSIERECRNLQDQIDTETAKDNAIKLDRVNKDIQDIRKETQLLLKSKEKN